MATSLQVILNGELIPAAQAKISPLSDGFLFGHGVFETLRARHGQALQLEAHHARLAASCLALGLDAPDSPDELGQRITRLLAALKLPQAAVKIVRFRDLSGTGELITARPLPYSHHDYLRGFRVKTLVQGDCTGRLTPHKTLNYLDNLLARRAAQSEHGDEALFVTPDGRVLEGAVSTVFAVKDGVATTPPLADGVLPGVTRARVLALLGPERAREARLTLDDLRAADEIFLTNALMGVMPVCTLDDHKLPIHAPMITWLRTQFANQESA